MVLILLGLLLLPLLEIAGFILVGGWIGLLPTLALLILAGVAGTWLLRLQGFLTLRRMRESMALGEPPVYEVFNGFCLAAAAILLIIPGFLTDIVALALLLPWVRRGLFDWLVSRSGGSEFWINGRRVSLRSRSQTIDGDFTDLTGGPPDRRLR